jgi:aminopeptidase N
LLQFKAWSRPHSIDQTAFALEVGTKVMPFFDDYFGIPFPLPEQGLFVCFFVCLFACLLYCLFVCFCVRWRIEGSGNLEQVANVEHPSLEKNWKKDFLNDMAYSMFLN